jgi:hypothetical protein
MRKLLCIVIAACAWAPLSFAEGRNERELREEIRVLFQDLRRTLDYDLFENELLIVRDGLRNIITDLDSGHRQSDYICMRQSNGLFYPSTRDGKIMGSTSYNSGYSDINTCKSSLPPARALLFCAKQSNGLFYPSLTETFAIVGSTSYSAGHAMVAECQATLPTRRRQDVTCYKQSNGLYYPSNAMTGQIIGSSSYSAGYSQLGECRNTIEQ